MAALIVATAQLVIDLFGAQANMAVDGVGGIGMRRSSGMFASLAMGASLVLPDVAMAQEVRDLDDATSDVRIFTGTLRTEPALYDFTLPPATALRIDVVPTTGSSLDPMVTVTDSASGEVLAEDDDGGEGLASMVRVFSDQQRRIRIAVSAFSYFAEDEEGGGFELQLRESDYRPSAPGRIAFASEATGMLETGGSDLYTIEGEEGQLLDILLVGDEDLDPLLELYRGELAMGDPMASDDDSGGELNSRLRYVLPASGLYTIRATSFGESAGAYTLRVAEASIPEIQAPQQAIGLAERLTGRLGEGYEAGSVDPAEITYQLTPEAIAAIRAGDGAITINMSAPDSDGDEGGFGSNVDCYLALGFETPVGFAEALTDDDGGEGLDARLAVDLTPLANEGDWLERLRIRVSSIGGQGEYAITITEGMQAVE